MKRRIAACIVFILAAREIAFAAPEEVPVPAFKIRISLTPKASERLFAAKESIVVAAYFEGDPKPKFRKGVEKGRLNLGDARKELWGAGSVAFDDVKLPKALVAGLRNPDYEVVVNVFSGRRTHPDNFLDCAIVSDTISNVKGKAYTLPCKLIAED